MFAKLVASIRRNGFVEPLIVRELNTGSYEIIGGAHRFKAAEKLGIPVVPVINLGKRSENYARRLMISLNLTKGDPDQDALASLVQSIRDGAEDDAEAAADLESLPFTDTQVAEMLDDGDNEDGGDDDDSADDNMVDARASKIRTSDVAAAFETEGASQADLIRILRIIREWRATKSVDQPAWAHLCVLLKKNT